MIIIVFAAAAGATVGVIITVIMHRLLISERRELYAKLQRIADQAENSGGC